MKKESYVNYFSFFHHTLLLLKLVLTLLRIILYFHQIQTKYLHWLSKLGRLQEWDEEERQEREQEERAKSGGKRRRSSSASHSSSTRHHHEIVHELQELVPCQTFDAGKIIGRVLFLFFFYLIFGLFFLTFFFVCFVLFLKVFVDRRGDQEVELGTRSLMSAPHVAMSTYSNIDKGETRIFFYLT